MTAKEFFDCVKSMRKWQRDYENYHDGLSKRKAMEFERVVDGEIQRVSDILREESNLPNQLNLNL